MSTVTINVKSLDNGLGDFAGMEVRRAAGLLHQLPDR